MKKSLTLLTLFLTLSNSIQAQNASPYWSLSGNTNASSTSKLGTTNNISLRFYTNDIQRMIINSAGNVGIGTATPNSPLSFPNKLGNKISFWHAGNNNDFGIGLNTGVLQFFTAGQDKIAFGFGNTNSFNERLSILTGTGQLNYSNRLGTKISFWHNGPDNDFGIGINTGVMQFFTAGQDKIAFGWGNTNNFKETMTFFTGSGQLGIGTLNPGTYKLAVNGSIRAKEVRVESGWADYVFEKNYRLPSLDNVADYIDKNKHLPGIPSAKEIQDNGLAVGEMQSKMMEKIEEFTLYMIQIDKKNKELQKEVDLLRKEVVLLGK